MVDMQPRSVATSLMNLRQSTAANVYNYKYNEPNVRYNEPLVTYNFYSYRGEMGVRAIGSPNMRGR